MAYSVSDFEQNVKKALSDMILQVNSYFWGSLSVYFGIKIVDNDVPACAYTDYKNIYFNVKYINEKELQLSKEEMQFIIMHELLHIVLGHDFRRKDKIPELWNIACDLVINYAIVNEHIGKQPEFVLFDNSVKDLSAEAVYKKLLRRYGKVLNAALKQIVNDCGIASDIQLDVHPEGDISDIDNAAVKSIISNHVKNFSHSGSELAKRIIDQIEPEPIDFRLFLRNYMKPYMKNEYTWSRPLKKGLTHGYYIPSYKNNHRLIVNIGIDTSGSISDTELKKFFGAFMSLISQFQFFKIRVWFFSTEVHDKAIYEITEKDNRFKFINTILESNIPSKGGTYIQSNFDYIKENKLDSDIFICMTDGEDELSTIHYDGNVLWAIIGNENFENPIGCKFGKVMHIQEAKNEHL